MSAMKGLNSIIYAAFAAAAVLCGCAKETISEQTPSAETGKYHVTFTAQKADDEALVKAGISADDNKVINWSVGDSISVFDGAGKNCKFVLSEGAGTPKGKFEGEVRVLADSYTVLYPYQKDATIDAGTGTLKGVFLKGDQTAVKGSFDPEAGLMAARSGEGNTIAFRNIVGYLMFKCAFDCTEVIVARNKSAQEGIADTLGVAFDATTGDPVAQLQDTRRRAVFLEGDIKADTPYYITLLPFNFEEGFHIYFTDTDEIQHFRNTDKPFTVKQGVVTDLGVFSKANTEIDAPYITFYADAEQTFTFTKGSDVTIDEGLFEYSVNGGAWTTMVADTPIKFVNDDRGLRLRGKSLKGTSDGGSIDKSYNVQFGNDDVQVNCSGDIRTLIDYENYIKVNTGDARFAYLFKDAVAIKYAPELPMTELATSCYNNMFSGTSITYAPMLPALNVPARAYYSMFGKCSSLLSMPWISATSVEDEGMHYMFAECGNLQYVHDLKITEFKGDAYSMWHCARMFLNCTSLKTAPALPAENLGARCYLEMFKGCTSLEKAPALPARKLTYLCYSNMFCGCTGLVDVPALVIDDPYNEACVSMFWKCSSLKSITVDIKDFSTERTFSTWLDATAPNGVMHIREGLSAATKEFLKCPASWTMVEDITD